MSQIERAAFNASNAQDQPWPADANSLARLLVERYSCRAFRPEPVPRPVIDRMLGIAQLSASWCNTQPWEVIVTEGKATEQVRAKLYDHAAAAMAANSREIAPDFPFPGAYRGIYKDRQREVGWQLYESVGVTHGDRVASARQALENFNLFGAPHMLVITSDRDLGIYGAVDCGLYIGSLLLAAQSLGIGMIAQAALATYAPVLREHFKIPEDRMLVIGASFGYADDQHPANAFRSRRAPLPQAVSYVTA